MKSPENLLKGVNILIVDDDIRNTFALSSYLKVIGMKIYTAESSFQAIDFSKNHHTTIKIILMI